MSYYCQSVALPFVTIRFHNQNCCTPQFQLLRHKSAINWIDNYSRGSIYARGNWWQFGWLFESKQHHSANGKQTSPVTTDLPSSLGCSVTEKPVVIDMHTPLMRIMWPRLLRLRELKLVMSCHVLNKRNQNLIGSLNIAKACDRAHRMMPASVLTINASIATFNFWQRCNNGNVVSAQIELLTCVKLLMWTLLMEEQHRMAEAHCAKCGKSLKGNTVLITNLWQCQ